MTPAILTLTEAVALIPAQARSELGSKAANLAKLASAGFPVPPGFVIPTSAVVAGLPSPGELTRFATSTANGTWVAAATDRGRSLFAVRSSGVAEDLAEASFAGQYDTVLNVAPEDLPEAVRHVLSSATSLRAEFYRHEHDPSAPAAMAVLVQVMVDPDAAGVAFTANPLTGDRGEVVVTAVRGLGERLVSGEDPGERWTVRADARLPTPEGGSSPVLTPEQAEQVADLARRVEAASGSIPQDIEWAISGGRLYLLQARPMTALPEQVSWVPPHDGWWLRNFRLGEWFPEPVTPLFADWLLPRIEHGIAVGMSGEFGLPMRPESAIVNGWYFCSAPPEVEGSLPLQLLRHPRALTGLPATVVLITHPERVPGRLAKMTRHWRDELLPRYRAEVVHGEIAMGAAATTPPQAVPASSGEPGEVGRYADVAVIEEIVDRVADVAGEYSWSVATLAGSQWKVEAALSRFCRRHLPNLGESPLILVSGLPGAEPTHPPYAVHSIDWYWPTLGEHDQAAEPPAERQRELAERRAGLEARARETLRDHPWLLRRFQRLLAMAQTYAVAREQQTREFSLGWPLLRQCALLLGRHLSSRGVLPHPEDVFFLTKTEVDAGLHGRPGPLPADAAAKRRTAWESRRRLSAPLALGTGLAAGRRFYANAIAASRSGVPADGVLTGDPASPGRARGPVRVIFDPAEFPSFRAGEILVTRVTAPAWTPLFAQAAAVVTDGGSLAAHASLVAREYGIPAVVATGDATQRLRDGQMVTVDGGAGTVEVEA